MAKESDVLVTPNACPFLAIYQDRKPEIQASILGVELILVHGDDLAIIWTGDAGPIMLS